MLRKFAVFEVMGAWSVPQGASDRSLARIAHRVSFDYQVRPGYLYVRSRMISSRCNDNWDEFPADEISKSYQTFVGKPVFVNHHNANHRRARGVIIRVALHEDRNPDGTPDTWVEGLMEVDAVRFPRLAKAILAGRIDRTSMGVDVDFSKCSACGNIAADVADYCQHIPAQKGRRHVRYEASGDRKAEFIRETCYGLRFFENSLLVEEPADPTAVFTGVDASGLRSTAGRRTAAPADEPDFRDHLGNHCLGCGDRVKWNKHPTKGGWRHYSPGREYDHAPMPSDPDDKSRPMGAAYGGTDCLMCHEPVRISLDHLKTPTGGWSHHDGMKRDHPAIPADARKVYDAIPGIKARQQQANQQMGDHLHQQFEQLSGHPLPRRDRGDEASMPPDPFTAARHGAPFAGYEDFEACEDANRDKDDPAAYCGEIKHRTEDKKGSRRTAAVVPHPRTSAELAVHLDRGHRLEPRELAGNDHWDLHHEEHSGGWPDEDHTHEPFYHGTSLGSDEDWPSHVRPAGAGHLYPGEHSGEHAFAISDPSSAWDYAEKTYSAGRGEQPRVLRVRPTGPFEEDPVYHGDTLRSPGQGSVRSRHPWAVTGEEDIPEGHQRGYEDEDGMGRTAALQAEAAGPKWPDPGDHPWFQAHPVSHLHVIHAFHDSTPGERASGASWYKDAHHVAKAIAGGDAAKGAGVLSAYSPRTFWPANMFHASRSFREGRAIGPGEGANVMGMHQKPAAGIIEHGKHWSEVLNGPKTRAFAHLIEHGGESEDDIAHNTGPVVVDRHAMSVAAGHRLSDADMAGVPLDHPHYYGHVVKQYQHAAADLSEHYGHHIAPHEVQATTWLRQVRLNTESAQAGTERLEKGRMTRQKNDQNKWNDTAREHHPSIQHLFSGSLWPPRTAARRLAYGETRVPPEVDTLRDEECPVCGERDVYSGQRCPVCGFVSPPQMFKDPDLEKAKQIDLRQDQTGTPSGDPTGAGGGTTLPQEGLQQPGQEMAGQAPDAQGSYPDADSQLFHPDQLAPDGVPGAEQGAADSPGQPGGPTLLCPVCGFTVPAAGAVTQTTTPEQPAAMGFSEGDPCPNCGQGQLMSSDDMQMAGGLPPGEQANAGQGELPAEADGMAQQGFGAPGLGGLPQGDPEGMPLSPEDSAAVLGQQPVMPGPGDELAPGAEGEQGEEFPEEQQAAEDDAEAGQEQEDEEAAEEEGGGAPVDDDDDPMNRRSKQSSREGSRMTSALEAALAAQQRQLGQLVVQNRQLMSAQRQILGQNAALHAQLRLVGSLAGIEPEMAAIEQRVAHRLAPRRADMNNPASPVPDPPEQPAPESTEQALQPDAMDDPRRPGLTPGSVTNVPAMQTTTPLRPGVEDQVPPATNLIDVTAPVQGTNPAQDGGVPLSQRRIETDVRVGDPMNPQIAFPWNPALGPDQQDQMTGPQDTGQSGGGQPPQRQASREDQARARMMGSMRLARLRVQAGIARGDETTLAGQIEADASLSTAMIDHEIGTLTQMGVGRPRQATAQRQAPRTAATRAVPSMSSAPRPVMAAAQGYAGEDDLTGDADLFM